jgi:hypothetical protein
MIRPLTIIKKDIGIMSKYGGILPNNNEMVFLMLYAFRALVVLHTGFISSYCTKLSFLRSYMFCHLL